MDTIPFDDHSDRRSPGDPGVRFLRAEGEDVRLWYGTFDLFVRLLHDLWWQDRQIGRLKLLADWLGDRGVFDPDGAATIIDDCSETRAALVLVRERLARQTDLGDEIETALFAIIQCLDAAIADDQPVRIERI